MEQKWRKSYILDNFQLFVIPPFKVDIIIFRQRSFHVHFTLFLLDFTEYEYLFT